MIVYVVEIQSQYDGGGSQAVFETKEKAIQWIESKNDFTGWEDDSKESTKCEGDDFFYNIIDYEVE